MSSHLGFWLGQVQGRAALSLTFPLSPSDHRPPDRAGCRGGASQKSGCGHGFRERLTGLLTEGLGSSLCEARSPPEFQMELVRWAGGLTESETQGRGPGRRCKFGITRHINLKPREWMRPPNKCKQAEERYRAGPGGCSDVGEARRGQWERRTGGRGALETM